MLGGICVLKGFDRRCFCKTSALWVLLCKLCKLCKLSLCTVNFVLYPLYPLKCSLFPIVFSPPAFKHEYSLNFPSLNNQSAAPPPIECGGERTIMAREIERSLLHSPLHSPLHSRLHSRRRFVYLAPRINSNTLRAFECSKRLERQCFTLGSPLGEPTRLFIDQEDRL